MRYKEIDKYTNAQTKMFTKYTASNVFTVHKKQCGRNRVLIKKAITQTLYFKNGRKTACVGLRKRQDKANDE